MCHPEVQQARALLEASEVDQGLARNRVAPEIDARFEYSRDLGDLTDTDLDFTLQTYSEHDIDHRSDSRAASYISIQKKTGEHGFGVGIDSDISVASMKAVLSALNRL